MEMQSLCWWSFKSYAAASAGTSGIVGNELNPASIERRHQIRHAIHSNNVRSYPNSRLAHPLCPLSAVSPTLKTSIIICTLSLLTDESNLFMPPG
jgi:hypothetical protein